jgi:hypothetical protein
MDFAADMDSIFLTAGFEEPIVFIDAIGSHTGSAVIFRDSEETIRMDARQGGAATARKYKIELEVSRTLVPSVRVNADKIQCKRMPGDAAVTTFNVIAIVRADAGAYRLGLGA